MTCCRTCSWVPRPAADTEAFNAGIKELAKTASRLVMRLADQSAKAHKLGCAAMLAFTVTTA